MNVVFLSLGGNLGNRSENLSKAIKELKAIGAGILKISSVYETEAWGSISKKKYLNQVVQLKTSLTAAELLKHTLHIEKKMGRVRGADRNSDRVIDIDMLFFNDACFETKTLHIPHPRLQARKFVLIPLNEIAGNFVHPGLKKSIRTLLKNCKDQLEVKRHSETSTFRLICIEGNIGSGKTTIAKSLAKKLKADFLTEEFETNYLLPLFYSDPKRHAFHLEYSLLLSRTQQLYEYLKAPGQLVICDFSLYKSLWFAKQNLSKTEYDFFDKKAKTLLDGFPKPDLIIYLDTDLKNLKANIKRRGRIYEKNIVSTYLRAIDSGYKKGLAKLSGVKKITLPIKQYTAQTQEQLTQLIEEKLKEIV